MGLGPSPSRVARLAAAAAAVALVQPGMTVGLGTGDTAAHAIRALAYNKLPGLRCVATSERSAVLARALGLALLDLDDVFAAGARPIALTIDGADEIDPQLQLSKGGGGALLCEKLVAQASQKLVVIVDEEKRVHALGEKRPLAIEVVRFGARFTLDRIARLPPIRAATLRLQTGASAKDAGSHFVTDSGHFIVDATLDPSLMSGTGAQTLHAALKALPGVVETGLFCHEAAVALVGRNDGSVDKLGGCG